MTTPVLRSPNQRRRGPAPGTPRGPRMTRDDRRTQLLDIAEAAFGEVGFHDTTMDMVAARAEITKPVLYDHFGSKENLLAAVVERAKDDLVRGLTSDLLALPPDTHAKEVVRTGVRAFMDFVVARKAAFRAYLQEDTVMRVDDRSRGEIRDQFAVVVRDVVSLNPGGWRPDTGQGPPRGGDGHRPHRALRLLDAALQRSRRGGCRLHGRLHLGRPARPTPPAPPCLTCGRFPVAHRVPATRPLMDWPTRRLRA